MIGGSGCGSGPGPGCGCVLGCWCGAGPECGPGPGPDCGWLGLGLGLGPSSMVGPGPGCVAGHCWGLVVAIHHGHRRSRCHRRRSCRHYRHRKPWLAIASHGWTTAIAVCRFSPRQWVRGVVGRGGCTRGILAAPPPPPHSRCSHRRRRRPHHHLVAGGGRGGCTRGILAAPPPPPRSRCRHRRRRSCSLLERRLAIAVIVIIATVTFYESVHQCELHSRVNCYERCNPRGVPCLGQQV